MRIVPANHEGLHCAFRAFTLTELMVATAVFMLAVLGLLYLHIFGLRMNELVRTKLGASEDARRAVSLLAAEIRAAGVVRVGTGDSATFSETPFGSPQEGAALEVYPLKTDTNTFIRYYFDPEENRLKRQESGAASPTVVAGGITNSAIFTAEDFTGKILTNNSNNRVIGVRLQFFQIDNPAIRISAGSLYDYYQLQTRITRRALE